jgi:hypothetical protein
MPAGERSGEVASLASRLRQAAAASRAAEYRRMSGVISHCVDELERLLDGTAPRRVVELALARGQRALEVWQALSSF